MTINRNDELHEDDEKIKGVQKVSGILSLKNGRRIYEKK